MRSRVLLIALSLFAFGCKDKPGVNDLAAQARVQEEKKKAADSEAKAKEKAALDALLPQVLEARKPLDLAFAAIYDALPPLSSLAKLKTIPQPCPDDKITEAVPSPDGRKVLLINQENLFTLSGKGDGLGLAIHTLAGDEAQWMRRPEGMETRLFNRTPPEGSAEAKERIEAAKWIAAHRYIGVVMISRFRASTLEHGKALPARVEATTVVFDRETKKQLCATDGHGENLPDKPETINIGRTVYEDLWTMYLATMSRNFDNMTKVLTVEGFTRKR